MGQGIKHKTITQNTQKCSLKTRASSKPNCWETLGVSNIFPDKLTYICQEKERHWAAVNFNGMKSNVEDKGVRVDKTPSFDTLICSEHTIMFIRRDDLSKAVPFGGVKKRPFTIPQNYP